MVKEHKFSKNNLNQESKQPNLFTQGRVLISFLIKEFMYYEVSGRYKLTFSCKSDPFFFIIYIIIPNNLIPIYLLTFQQSECHVFAASGLLFLFLLKL